MRRSFVWVGRGLCARPNGSRSSHPSIISGKLRRFGPKFHRTRKLHDTSRPHQVSLKFRRVTLSERERPLLAQSHPLTTWPALLHRHHRRARRPVNASTLRHCRGCLLPSLDRIRGFFPHSPRRGCARIVDVSPVLSLRLAATAGALGALTQKLWPPRELVTCHLVLYCMYVQYTSWIVRAVGVVSASMSTDTALSPPSGRGHARTAYAADGPCNVGPVLTATLGLTASRVADAAVCAARPSQMLLPAATRRGERGAPLARVRLPGGDGGGEGGGKTRQPRRVRGVVVLGRERGGRRTAWVAAASFFFFSFSGHPTGHPLDGCWVGCAGYICAPSPSAAVGPLPPCVRFFRWEGGSLWPDNDGGRPSQPTNTGEVWRRASPSHGWASVSPPGEVVCHFRGGWGARGGAVPPRRPRRRRRGVEDPFTKTTGRHPPRTAARGLHWPIARTRRARRSTPRGLGVDTPPDSNGHPVRGPPSPTLGGSPRRDPFF